MAKASFKTNYCTLKYRIYARTRCDNRSRFQQWLAAPCLNATAEATRAEATERARRARGCSFTARQDLHQIEGIDASGPRPLGGHVPLTLQPGTSSGRCMTRIPFGPLLCECAGSEIPAFGRAAGTRSKRFQPPAAETRGAVFTGCAPRSAAESNRRRLC